MTHVIPMSEKDAVVAGLEKKRKKPTRLSDRSRKYLQELGYYVTFVERSYQIEKRANGVPTGQFYWQKFDAFNVADILAIKEGEPGTLYVQTTEHSHAAEHKNTILGEVYTRTLLKTGNRIHLHVWKKRTVQKRDIWGVQVLDCQLGDRQSIYFRDLGAKEDVDGSLQKSASLFADDDGF